MIRRWSSRFPAQAAAFVLPATAAGALVISPRLHRQALRLPVAVLLVRIGFHLLVAKVE
jgi:hypothetical protein